MFLPLILWLMLFAGGYSHLKNFFLVFFFENSFSNESLNIISKNTRNPIKNMTKLNIKGDVSFIGLSIKPPSAFITDLLVNDVKKIIPSANKGGITSATL